MQHLRNTVSKCKSKKAIDLKFEMIKLTDKWMLDSEIRPLSKDVKDYRKCVDPFSKQVISIILPNLTRSLKRVCVTHKQCKQHDSFRLPQFR